MGFRSFWKGGTGSLLLRREEMSMSQNVTASQRAGVEPMVQGPGERPGWMGR